MWHNQKKKKGTGKRYLHKCAQSCLFQYLAHYINLSAKFYHFIIFSFQSLVRPWTIYLSSFPSGSKLITLEIPWQTRDSELPLLGALGSISGQELRDHKTTGSQASLSFTISRSLTKFMFIELVMPPNHLILCHPLLLLSSIFPRIWVFSNELALHIKWPKYWSFSFRMSPSNEYSRLISFRIDKFDLLAVQGTLKESSPTAQFKSINSSVLSFLYGPTLTSIHDYWKNHSFD